MAVTEQSLAQAEKRAQARRRAGYAVAARYDRHTSRVVVKLNTDVQISFPARLAEGLADASPDDLAAIEISPSGLGLHWPKLDADLYVSGLLAGQFGSKRWMAAQLGAAGGRVRSPAKTAPAPARMAARAAGRAGRRATVTTAFATSRLEGLELAPPAPNWTATPRRDRDRRLAALGARVAAGDFGAAGQTP